MKIVFLSNFLNHHQLPLCKALTATDGVEYYFVATTPIPDEQLKLGYEDMNNAYDFVIRAYESKEAENEAIFQTNDADMVLMGSAPQRYIKDRMKLGKLVIRYSERIYKNGVKYYKLPYRILRRFIQRFNEKNVHLLCASAFASADYAKTFDFIGKAYKWGYFPEVKRYDDIDSLIKSKDKASILWVARLIKLKNPEYPIKLAYRLKQEGYDFNLNILGRGEMEEELRRLIDSLDLNDRVHLLGAKSPDEVREYMEKSQIFLFTSNKQEGWGAVMNESMNSGCAVVASSAVGSVPFLIDDGVNGLIYKSGDTNDLYKKVKYLLDNQNKAAEFGKKAYETLANQWNAENAAERLVVLTNRILNNEKPASIFADGVCSPAERLHNRWYK